MSKPVPLTLNADTQLEYRRFRRILDASGVTITSVHRNPDSMVVHATQRDGDVERENAYFFSGKSVQPLIARGTFRKVAS